MAFRPLKALCAAVVCLIAIKASTAGAVPAPALRSGLVATFTDGIQTIQIIEPSPDFVLKEGESIHPQLGQAFKAQWQGVLRISKKAAYTFAAEGAADAVVTLDKQPLLGRPIELDAGDHELSVTYERKTGPARLQLVWKADFFSCPNLCQHQSCCTTSSPAPRS